MAWIGTLGNLVEFKCPARLSRSTDHVGTVKTTLGGADKAFVEGVPSARSWNVDLSAASPSDVSALQLLEAGAFGRGPFVFVDPWAEVTNLLSPRASLPGFGNEFAFTGGSAGSASIPGVGGVPVVIASSGNVDVAKSTPVVPGLPVTGSVFVQGSAAGTVTLKFLNSVGTLTHSEVTSVTFGSWARVSVTGNAIAGDHSALITVNSGAQFQTALPAVTWTDSVKPYTSGQGAPNVVITGSGLDALRATPGQQLAAQSLTLRELRRSNA